ncbi:hypothetical protein PsorP6_016423 [Peronosclerospora sorghi]|uniref:Uncharacterized protein n=1 Tax=Peronosclerospora sorghi TaxID=230839 RepID=A0ACC0VLZ2_9STRA|nr:hypothetical protein PsorP6_016423 [Peronosclerospora sorghi]
MLRDETDGSKDFTLPLTLGRDDAFELEHDVALVLKPKVVPGRADAVVRPQLVLVRHVTVSLNTVACMAVTS